MSTEFLIDTRDGELSGWRADPSISHRLPQAPLIVALHGGSYSSRFFDVPGYSLLDRAVERGCSAIALDRPGYGASSLLSDHENLLESNAERLSDAIATLWIRHGESARGIVLVGHSIGAAISILMAAQPQAWPLLGIAVSGIGLIVPPGGPTFEAETNPQARRDVPSEMKNTFMFGPPGSYAEDAPQKAAIANEPVVYREIVEINTQWPRYAPAVCARVRVPVHFRQGEHDAVWTRGAGEIERFRQAFSSAPSVDAEMVKGVAHSIDFHHRGQAFQNDQIAFAIACTR